MRFKGLGSPTRDGIPIVIGARDWMMTRVLPIPAPGKGETPRAEAPVPSIDGYVAHEPIERKLPSLPVCGRTARGMRFVLQSTALRGVLDGSPRASYGALFDVRIDGTAACVAGIRATFAGSHRGDAPDFVRADFTRNLAEGGARGPGASVAQLACTLGKP